MTWFSRALICALILIGSLCAFLATDLVLPAIPTLPEALGGGVEEGQFVLASFIAGGAAGLLIFGAISWRFDRRKLLLSTMAVFGAVSLACTFVTSIWPLIGLRFFQGFFSMVPAVIGPGILRQMFSDKGATKAIGLLGSLEALAPALGPIAGAGLLALGGWTLSFTVLGVMGLALAGLLLFLPFLPPLRFPAFSDFSVGRFPAYLDLPWRLAFSSKLRQSRHRRRPHGLGAIKSQHPRVGLGRQ